MQFVLRSLYLVSNCNITKKSGITDAGMETVVKDYDANQWTVAINKSPPRCMYHLCISFKLSFKSRNIHRWDCYTFPLYFIIIHQDTLARIQFHCLYSRYFLLFKQVLQITLVCILSGNCKTTLLTYVGRRMGHIFCKDSLLPSDYLMKQFYAQRISKLHVCQIDSCV